MKQPAFHYLFTITVFFLFATTVFGQTTTGTGSLLNKRYPVTSTATVSGGANRTKKAPVQSISVNEDPVFNEMSPTELVKQAFITGCLLADNIKFGYYKKSGSNWTWTDHAWSVPNNRQMGYFKKGTSNFPIDEGIILSTGIASSAMGPNNMEGRSDLMVAGASDPDLSLISGQDMNDAAILEFDFVPAGNTMEFKYTFSSEEYLEYINSSFNDAFGFFLSGPGINGTYRNNAVNLAVLPNGDPVTINTIHPAGTNIAGQAFAAKNEEYYIDNPLGSPTVQFDGGTVVLTATYPVTPCQTYHIKLCVADAYDQEFDGAVFLAAKSFNSENVLLTNYGNDIEGLNDIFEGCTDHFRIERSSPDISDKLDLNLVLSGTATNGVDIMTTGDKPFPTKVTIPKNSSFIDIPYYSVADAISDNGETFTIKIPTSCPCAPNVVYVEKTLTIYEHLTLNSISTVDVACYNQSNGKITVNTSGGTGNFEYSKNNGTTWQRSNVFSNLAPGTYAIKVRDPGSCYSAVSGTATVGNPPAIIANAGSPITICSGQSTQLNGSGGVLYSWSPAAGLSATNIANPIANPTTTTTYTLTATNALGLCSSTSTVTVTVNPSPVASLTQLNLEICKGSSTTLTASGGNTYLWNPGGATTAAITVSPVTTTNYTVVVTAPNGCTDFKTATVTVNDIPSLFNVTGGGSYCAGGTGVAVGLSGSQSGVNYQLKLNGSNTGSPIAGNGSALSFGNKTLAGTYTVESTMTSTSCIITMSGNAIIVVNSAPVAPVVGIITQPTCTVATGSVVINGLPAGNWTINPGAVAGTGVSKTMSGLAAGTYTYTVTNSVGCTSPPSANILINTQPITPVAPIVGTVTQPTCSVATGSVVINGLPAGNWMLNPGAIAGTGASKTLSGLVAGTYSYTVTNDDGCISPASANIVINTQPATPSAPTVGAITQPTCALATGSVVLNGLPTGNWTINPGAIAGTGASTTITGLAAGTYSYTVTNAAGCTSSASPNIVITAAIPVAPITGTITQPTCTIATGSIVLNGLPTGNWTINPGAIAGTGASKTITGLTAGTYSYTLTNALGCISSPTANIVISPQPLTPIAISIGAIIHPTCVVTTGSVTLNDLPAGNWTINPGAITGTGASKTISGLAAGTYTFTVTNASGCTSSASANVVINAQPVIPSAPLEGIITQPTCSVAIGSVVLNGLPAGNWTINPGAIAGNTASTTISGLAAGTYTYTVAQGCTSAPSVNIVINAQPATPSAPIVGTITQPTCTVATGSVILNGLPAGTWTINPGAIAGTGSSYTKSGLATGTYNFTVTNSSGCSSVASSNIVINSQPVTPSVVVVGTVTQPTCTVATGSVVLSGLPAGNWTINPGAIAGTGATYTKSGLASGTYTYTVTNSIGCSSSASANVVINAQPVTPIAPIAGTITHPTCTVATGSVVLNGLPAGNWTINPGAIAGTGASQTLSGLAPGTYNLTVTNTAGCISPASNNIVINTQPVTPPAPLINLITQPDCGVATGSVVLGGLPGGTWTINPGARTGSGSTVTINNLLAGTYNYTVTNSAGCTSLPTANIVIVADPGTPAAPTISTITQPSCSVATGSVLITGLPAGSWTINPGAVSGSGSSTTISGLATGTYTFTVTNGVGCISLPSISVVIGTQPVTPSAPVLGTITQPTCALATGSVVLNGLPAGNWTINPGAITGTGSSYTVSGVVAGTYAFTVTNSVGCTSMPTADVVIIVATPTAPIVGAITHPTCTVATGSVVLSGLPVGNWIINPGAISGTGLNTTISGLAAGTRTFTVTNSLGCTSPASASVVINAQPATPTAPVIGVITQPTCTVSTGSVVLNSLPAGNWTINPGAIAGTGTSKTLTGISSGTYTYTVTNAVGCTSPASANVVINAQPVTPSAPAISSIAQPTCEVATGIVELAGLPTGNWTINPGAIAGTGSSKTISGLIAGTYNYTVSNSVGCTSSASANVVIIANPGTPAAPSIGTITQPTCAVSTGSVQLNGLPAGNWTINPGNMTGTGSSIIISGIVAGTYNYTVTNASGCISLTSSNVVINVQPVTPSVPTLGTITQPTCAVATGSVILNGLPTGNWTINPGAIAGTGLTKTVSGLASGTYSFTVTNSVGCTSAGTANVVINTQPVTPPAPTIGTITQTTCAVSTGSVVLNGLPSGNWTINPGAIAGTGSSLTISGLAAGTRTFTVTNSVGCTSTASASVVINAQPVTPSAPTVGIITQPTCTVATGSVVLNGLPAGNWTINPGAINGNTTSTTISGLASGTYNYTVTNASGCTSVSSANIVINTQPLTPSAPTIGTVAQPTCSVATGTVELNDLPLGNWTINPGAIAGIGVTKIVSGITSGTMSFTVTNASGCISPASVNVIINVQPVTPSTPVISSITQPTCSISTGSVLLSGLPAGNWTIDPGAITGNTTSTTISGLFSGTYNYTVTNSAGCTSIASANIVINTQPSTPTAPGVGTITQPNCLTSIGSVLLSGLPAGNWILNPGAIAGTGATKTLSGLVAGTYAYSVTNASGCTSSISDDIVINPQPVTPTAPVVSVNTQPTCSIATGSLLINGLPAGNWIINPGSIAGTGSSTAISSLIAGAYSYTVTNSVGCTSSSSTNAVINVQPVTPTAPIVGLITQPSCEVATGSVVLNGLPAGNWTINPGAIAGTGSSKTISGLVAGTYSYSIINASGCTSLASANIVILPQPSTPSSPLIGAITQPTCTVATGNVIVNGLPSGNWIINPGAIAGSGASITLTGLTSGTYNYSVTNSVGCISLLSADVVINLQPVTPSAPNVSTITQPECAVLLGSSMLSGLPTGNWTINPGAITGTGPSTTISNLPTGTYSYTVTNAVGCTSEASANIVVNTPPLIPATPIIVSITQPTCNVPTGSVVLGGLPPRNWIVNPGGILGNTSTVAISPLLPGTYNYTVTKVGGCSSLPSEDVVINAQPPTPPSPTVSSVVQPACAGSTGTITISAPTGAGMTYSINGSTYTNTTGVFTLLTAGTYPVSAKNSFGCISPSTSITVNTAPDDIVFALPQVTMVKCNGGNDGIIKISASGGTGTISYSISPNIGTQSPSGTFNNLIALTYTITATDANGCTKSTSVAVGTTTDVTLPTITCLANITATTNTGCTATGVILGTPITTDNCGVASVTNNAPAVFPLGVTAITWTVTDNSGNQATCDQTVTITDDVLPTIICPANVNATTNTGCTATGVVLGTPVTADNCGVVSVTNNAPSAFPLGATTVTWTVTDNSGNKATCDQTVTITDNVLPTITCPANVTTTTNTGCTATGVVLGTPITADNCGVATVTNNAPPVFPIGVTTITWTVTDNSGNKNTCDQTITVSDNVLPIITCPANISQSVTSGCSKSIVVTDPAFGDNCSATTLTWVMSGATTGSSAASGINVLGTQSFNVGITTVTYMVKDAAGNTATCSFTITVTDTIIPTITCPANISQSVTSGCSKSIVVTDPAFGDNCTATTLTWVMSGATTGSSAASGINVLGTQSFNVGITTVTYTVKDAAGNTATCSFTVTITDTIIPTITCPANISQSVTSGCSNSIVVTDPAFGDNCSATTLTWVMSGATTGSSAASGINVPGTQSFNVGITTVTYTVKDAAGNTAICSFTVTVTDTINPTITCPVARTIEGCSVNDITSPAFSSSIISTTYAIFSGAPNNGSASDNCGTVTVSYIDVAIGSCPITVTRTWTITDAAGNSTSCTQEITIDDNTPPIISCPALFKINTNVLSTYVGPIGIATATDNCTSPVSISNNAPSIFPLGSTSVIWTATDGCGNTSSCTQVVDVSSLQIIANDDLGSTVNGYSGGISLSNVLSNDILNTLPVNPSDVALTFISSTNPGVSLNGTNVVVAAGTPVGSYTLAYRICEVLNPSNCDQADVTVTVSAASIIANDDIGSAVNGYAGGTSFTNVLSNDLLNGVAVNPSEIVLTFVSSTNPGVSLNGTNVVVAAARLAGNYTLTYQICEVLNPTNCDQAIVSVLVTDDESPIVLCPPNVSINCITEIPSHFSTLAEFTAAGGSASDFNGINASSFKLASQTSDNLTCPETISRTYSIADNNGNTSTCTQLIIVKDTVAPVISPLPSETTIECPATPVFANAIATDNCTTDLSLTFNDVTIPGICTGAYSVIRTWTATDACGNSSTASQTINVQDVTAPIISTQASDLVVTCDGAGNVTALNTWLATNAGAVASDACSGSVSWSNNFTGLSDLCGASGSATVMFTATDNCGKYATTSATFTIIDNVPPVLSEIPNDTNVECISSKYISLSNELVVNGSFANATPPFGFTSGYIYKADTTGNTELEPEGLYSIGSDANTLHYDFYGPGRGGIGDNFMIVNGYPGDSQPIVWTQTITGLQIGSSYYFSAWARSLNDAGNYANLKFSINDSQIGMPTGPLPVGPADNNGPWIWTKFYGTWIANETTAVLSIVDLTNDADGNDFGLDDISFGKAVTAVDNCDSNPIVDFTETRTEGSCPISYTLTRTWTASDACGNTTSASQTINVQDVTAPVIAALPAPTTIDCPAVPEFATAAAVDECGSVFTLTYNDVKADGDCAGSYSVTRTWTAKDACGNTSTASQTINVQDITAPVIAALPATSTIDCPAVPEFATTTATDECGSVFTLTYNDVKTDGNCAGSYSVTRTWTAKDACGNTSTASQTINVQDITAPVIATLPATSTIDCPAVPEFATATATDECGSVFTLTYNDVKTDGNCAGSYSVTRTWTAKDACGNTSTASQTINVQDITAPVIAALPATSTINCPAVPEFATATATDECGSVFTLTYNDVKTDGNCAGSYSVTRTWTAKDACGNTSSASQTINVQDITAPVVAALPATSTIDCPAVPEFATATATDECGSVFTLTYNDVKTDGNCAGSYSVTRTWTAKDACGNTSSASQTINVQDITAPVIAALPATSTINCPAVPEFATATATDECGSVFTLTYNDAKTDTKREGTCPASYSITRTWIAKDACGNMSTASQTINVQDVKAPVLSAAPANVTVECNSVPPAAILTASDDCDAAPVVTFTEVRTNGTCPNSYILTRTWTATDACLNTSSVSQIITVQDVTAPILTCPADIIINNDPGVCEATITVPKPSVNENCGSYSLLNSINQTADASGLYPVGTTAIEWTVTDECGNTSKCSMTVIVIDNEKPVITCPSDITICSMDQVVLGTATATDNCGITGIINNAPPAFETGTTLVVWTATDVHGNTSTCTQTVTITPKVTVDAGTDATSCSDAPYTIKGATAANYNSVSWTHNGHGSLSNANILNPIYTPSAGESGAIEFTLTAKGTSACSNMEVSDKYVLTISPAITVNAGGDKTIISGIATSLAGTVSGGTGVLSYNWTPDEYLVNNSNSSLTPATLPLNNETVFTLTAIDAISGCSASDEVKISVDDVIRPIARDDYDTTTINTPITVNVTANDSDPIGLGLTVSITKLPNRGAAILNEDGTITYTPQTGSTGNDTLTYTICDKGVPSKCSSARLIITVLTIRESLEIYNLVTPNGDNQNDYWYIGGIDAYPDNKIILFNRWGDKVNEFKGYNNTTNRWDGTNEKGNLLPSGTYFYILTIKDLTTNTGWVLLRGKEE